MASSVQWDQMDLHIIQRQILQQLVHGKHRFSELQPPKVENNLFQYHLGKLMSAKVIEKNDTGYTLTPLGYQLALQWSTDLKSVRLQPTVVVMSLIKNETGELLVVERHKEPYLGMLAPPFGKLHYGETLLDAAVRDLHEKTGLQGIELRAVGVAELHSDGMHTIAHIFSGNGQTAEKGSFISVARLFADTKVMPGLEFLKDM